jgi:DNA invertase Pin-like site-specific DNA recombinase
LLGLRRPEDQRNRRHAKLDSVVLFPKSIIGIEKLTFNAGADDAFAKLQLQLMGAFAEFERNIIRKRQAEGIAKAKARGVYKDRKRSTVIDRNEVRKLKAEGLSTYKIADKMGISRMSVHRILNNAA